VQQDARPDDRNQAAVQEWREHDGHRN